MKIKIAKNNDSDDMVEFEGCMVSKATVDRILAFREEYSESIVDKPKTPKIDSKGAPINYGDNPSYIRLLRKEKYPTYIISKNSTASTAKMYSIFEHDWIPTPKLWQDYVYEGSLGIDYVYVDDKEIRQFINEHKRS